MSPFMTRLASFAVLAASMFLAVSSAPQSGYQFAADSETYLSNPVSEGFSCEGQAYGYYADVDNNCEIFHICLPIEDEAGEVIEYAQWSFICGNGTVFDQQTLSCNYASDAFPCEESEQLYGTVMFGILDNELKRI